MVVRSERGEDNLPEFVPLLLGGNDTRGRGSAVQVVDVEVNDANLRRWANGVSSLGRETNDIGARIVNVNPCVSCMNGRRTGIV